MYDYCRPIIDDSRPSFIEATKLRHPIIERIDNGIEYVPNDLSIGSDCNGIILYSMNACGKTSLLKACGLSVILAQIGCYVPAKSFRFAPFKCMMTRILSEDNMMKGQSSFVAEMSELRAILKRAHAPSTLVLADEITHGTEHTSGSSIFISSVEMLASRKVNFMFTTHLHNVFPFVSKIQNVRVFHLSVKFENDNIVFERKLKDGPGSSVYGLEVCEFLNMDKEFLARAFHIRNMITPIKTEPSAKVKMSRYNTKKPVNCCEICAYSKKIETDMPLDVHHVQQQSIQDCNCMINGTHVHSKSNLVTLCKQCHVKVHKGQIEIFGYKQTAKGLQLSFDAD
jgi:DNA mismatch repair protein MutS